MDLEFISLPRLEAFSAIVSLKLLCVPFSVYSQSVLCVPMKVLHFFDFHLSCVLMDICASSAAVTFSYFVVCFIYLFSMGREFSYGVVWCQGIVWE
jgi:hypothetical protein